MALNLKTLFTRSLTAIVFVIVFLGCVYWNYYSFSIFFLLVSILGLLEFYKLSSKLGAIPLQLQGVLSGILIYASNCIFNLEGIETNLKFTLLGFKIAVAATVFLMFCVAIFVRKENFLRDSLYTLGGIFYVVIPFSLLNQMAFDSENSFSFNPKPILGIVFLIWCNDTFAYLGGSLFGKNKMIERISPGKTWEGTITGVLLSVCLSYFLQPLYGVEHAYAWLLLGILVPVFATIGDLVESKMKREAGMKDSGHILPGHGGILDRFDSLLIVAPVVYLIYNLIR